jgi:lipopolysaccharide transport system permease protein/teichoic acid transport system permease protein
MWFVFQVGFKAGYVGDFPFIIWLMAGMFPWNYLSDSISSGTGAIIDKPFLVKKVLFRVSTLPVIKLLVASFLHIVFIAFLMVMLAIYGYMPQISNIQIVYYSIAASIFCLGLSWATSSIVIFFRDLGQIIGIVLQFGFWLTPIFWPTKMVPEKYLFFIKLNPAYYIVEGYRDAFLYGTWFWQKPVLTLYFWIVTLCIFLLGAFIFRKLRPHFADVL